MIPPGEFQLITFRYDAGEPQKLTNNVLCVLNHSLIDNLVFVLNGSSHVPKVHGQASFCNGIILEIKMFKVDIRRCKLRQKRQ